MAIRSTGRRWSGSGCCSLSSSLQRPSPASGRRRVPMRRLIDRFVALVCAASTIFVCALLLGLIVVIYRRGAPALSWTFLTEQIRQVGAQGGIFFNLVGTL